MLGACRLSFVERGGGSAWPLLLLQLLGTPSPLHERFAYRSRRVGWGPQGCPLDTGAPPANRQWPRPSTPSTIGSSPLCVSLTKREPRGAPPHNRQRQACGSGQITRQDRRKWRLAACLLACFRPIPGRRTAGSTLIYLFPPALPLPPSSLSLTHGADLSIRSRNQAKHRLGSRSRWQVPQQVWQPHSVRHGTA